MPRDVRIQESGGKDKAMGTNFYFIKDQKPPCPTCGHQESTERIHIGKSSAGWCFSLHVIPELGIHDLPDWVELWRTPGSRIEDEYGEEISIKDMFHIITNRSFTNKLLNVPGLWWEENHAAPGPNGLARHRIEQNNCIGYGAGTWDLIPGDFS